MTDRDVVERVAGLLKRAVVRPRRREPHHKQSYVTTIKGAPAVRLMNGVRAFVSSVRQSQIDRAISSWHGRSRRRNARSPITERDSGLEPFVFTNGSVDDDAAVWWLAGLLEGEGTFGIARRPGRAYPVVSVEMSDQTVVLRAAQILGASVQPREPVDPEWSVTYVARITGHGAAGWMRRLRDRMGDRRSAAIDVALAAYRPIRLREVPAKCVVPNCGKPHRSRGLCHSHYMSWSRDRAKGRTPRITPLR